MRRREIREVARQSVYALISINVSNWPECDLATGAEIDDLTDDEMAVLGDEFDRIKRRIWP
jgi:hypothetical protein